MKKNFTKLLAILGIVFMSATTYGQSISAVNISSNPNDCTNTTVAVDATQLCLNYIYNGVSSTVSGSTITVNLGWSTQSPICLGALAFVNEIENVGQLADGTYTLDVITYLDGVVQNTNSQALVVASCCPVNAAVQGVANICLGESALLVSNATNATSTYWSQNGATITTNDSLPLQFTNPGTYNYVLHATDGSCSDSVVYSVGVNTYPVVDLGADTTVCVGQSVLLDGSLPISGAAYSWSTGTTSPTYAAMNPGTYYLTVSNNGCTGMDSVTVNAIQTPVFNLGGNMSVCEGTPVVLDATVNQANVVYTWSNGATTPTINVTTGGTYDVTATNSVNCSHSETVTISFEALPVPMLPADTTLCPGATLQLLATVPGITNYSWSTGAATAGLLVDAAGTYTVTLTTDGGCVGTDDIVVSYAAISINLGDTIDLVSGSPATLDAGNAGSTFLWNTGATTQTIDVDSTGTYSVTVTNTAGCTETSSVVIVNTTSTNELKLKDVGVFPNPASDYLVVQTNDETLEIAIIVNSFGQVVDQVSIQNEKQINVSQLASGMYFIQFQNRDGQTVGTARFVKQ